MAEYHVGVGRITGDIYAGRLDTKGRRWIARSNVTEDAIMSVAGHVMKRYDGEMVARFNAPDGTRMRAEIVVSPDDTEEEA